MESNEKLKCLKKDNNLQFFQKTQLFYYKRKDVILRLPVHPASSGQEVTSFTKLSISLILDRTLTKLICPVFILVNNFSSKCC